MQLNSYLFILAFLPVALTGYWLLLRLGGRTAVLGWLVVSSLAFYAYASVTSLALLLVSVAIDYTICSFLLRRTLSLTPRQKQLIFALGIAINVAFLGYFKYRNFFLDTANVMLGTHFDLTPLLLPLGISFITFQKIAFLADVYAGEVKTLRFLDFLLFMFFFPKAIAGPIVHFNEVMPQLADLKSRSVASDIAVGLCLFSIGLFKKCIISDGIAPFVPLAFGPPAWSDYPPALIHAWVGVLAYTFQLYFDFSGYSDMALGAARMFGVRLPMNFNSPLKATSIIEFWSRWHISLTRFLTAYLYTPLVLSFTRSRLAKGKEVLRGKRSSFSAIAVLVGLPSMVTMSVSGLWHGAGWQFVLWGALHGCFITLNQAWRLLRPRFWSDQISYERVMKPIGFILTFTAVVVALVFFRAPSVKDALWVLGGMVGVNGLVPGDLQVLHQLGVDVPRFILNVYLPTQPFLWIVTLFLIVTLAPNSLDVLRRFQPALDFPLKPLQAQGSQAQAAESEDLLVQSASSRAARWRRELSSVMSRVRDEGVPLSPGTAVIAALMFTLGVLALAQSGAFVYGQF